MDSRITVCVTGAAGQIAYSLLPLLSSGRVFGERVGVDLRLLDIPPAAEAMRGVMMELDDGAYPNLVSVSAHVVPSDALRDVDVAVFVGGFPRRKGMLRKDLIAKNSSIFSEQGKVLNEVAKVTTKVVVVANPANTNCLILKTHAPKIPASNFTCLTMLDLNRSKSQIARRLDVPVNSIKRVAIWGNHSATQFPDAWNATIDGKAVESLGGSDHKDWLKGEFISSVQQRGKAIIEARKLSSAMSAANAVGDHLRIWLSQGTKEGDTMSMGVVSDGSYGIEKGLVFSFPVTAKNGEYTISKDYTHSDFAKSKIKASEKELIEERAAAFEGLGLAPPRPGTPSSL